MSRVCILSADRQLYDTAALLIGLRGHTATPTPGAYPLIWDADTVALPRLSGGQAVIAVCRDPDAIPEPAARRCFEIVGRPFDFVKFSDVLEAALSGAGKQMIPASRATRRPAISLDEPRRRLICGQNSVTLTPSELEIFNVLAARRGENVSREQLEQLCGGESLTVHMCALRRKLKVISRVPLLTTVHGQGYRLE